MDTLKYLLSLLCFAAIGLLFYGWVIWKQSSATWNPAQALYEKGSKKIQKALKRNGSMTFQELSAVTAGLSVHPPLSGEKTESPEPERFLKGLLSFMESENLITCGEEEGQIRYRLCPRKIRK